ncbi:MAG: hypothetical protein OXH86_14415 [Acidimicrobiaceae bacterium]|nr:hypothetical protein [Acidimicrobiaceae bacterium]
MTHTAANADAGMDSGGVPAVSGPEAARPVSVSAATPPPREVVAALAEVLV